VILTPNGCISDTSISLNGWIESSRSPAAIAAHAAIDMVVEQGLMILAAMGEVVR
jgi:hypothetical protein